MFTGIIQKVSTVRAIEPGHDSFVLKLENRFDSKSDPVELGESIAVNGVCLTVTSFNESNLSFDVSPATLNVTALGRLKAGSQVNLERSLRMGDRLSGHWVQGHVDGTARVVEVKALHQGYFVLTISLSEKPELLRYCVSKGSISIDGVSLTIQSLERDSLTFQLIPHTWSETAFSDLKASDLVNIEVDILAKYIERFKEYDQSPFQK